MLIFGDRDQRIELKQIAAIHPGPFHTNICEALHVGRSMLADYVRNRRKLVH